MYKSKEYFSYNIYNLCLDCFKHKNIKKYKNYIGYGYDKNNYEFDIILSVPYNVILRSDDNLFWFKLLI
jgi:hypothetical protein